MMNIEGRGGEKRGKDYRGKRLQRDEEGGCKS